MKTSELLLERLGVELWAHDIRLPEGTVLLRTNASGSQRNEGAWSWSAQHPEVNHIGGSERDVGSHYPMGVLLGCSSWTVSSTTFGVHIDPCGVCIVKYGRVRV